jgi:Xaa-Pro aminopeptidase
MDRTRLTDTDRIRRLIRETQLDGVIATAPHDVTHTSGYYNLDQRLLPEHLHVCFWPANGDPILLIPARERMLETFVTDVRTYPSYGGPPHAELQLLADAMSERGTANGRLGVDLEAISAASFHALRKLVPHASFEDAGALLERMRNVKTPAEIEIMRHAAAATDKAIVAGYAQATVGDTEKDIVDSIDTHTLKYGAEAVAFNIIASGPRTLLGHHRAEAVRVCAGDVIRVDYGGLFSGYYTDLARMAVVDKPTARQESIYARCLEIQRRCIDAIRPGATGNSIDGMARRLYADAGLPVTRNMFGHSIGLTVHERPVFAPGDDLSLEPQMVVCVENGWTDVEHAERYHLEDIVLVTKGSPEVLSDRFDDSVLYIIR